MTLSNRSPEDGQIRRRTYVACLNCGEELAYNWPKMRLERRAPGWASQSPVVVSISAGQATRGSFLPAENAPITQYH